MHIQCMTHIPKMVNNNNSSTKLKYRPAIHTYLFEVFCSPVVPLSGASVSPLFGYIFTVRFALHVMQVLDMRRRLEKALIILNPLLTVKLHLR